jgi:hypothetical protein
VSYYNFEATKLAFFAGPSLPRKQAGTSYKAYEKGSAAQFRVRKKEEGAATTLLVLLVIASHFNLSTQSTYISYNRIAREALTSVSSSKRAVHDLVASGHLLKQETDDRDCNTYRFGPAMNGTQQNSVDDLSCDDPPIDLTPPVPTPPKVVLPVVSEAATQLAAVFTELLAQPKKHSTVRRKHWPGTFDAMLADHSHADLLALLEWVFNINKFWHPKIRAYSGDPADYFAEHLDKIITAMAHPVTQSMSRIAPRTAPKYDIDAYLNHN